MKNTLQNDEKELFPINSYKSVIKKNNFETLFDTAFKADTDYLLKVKIQILLSLSSFQIHILKLTVFRQVKIGREKKKVRFEERGQPS